MMTLVLVLGMLPAPVFAQLDTRLHDPVAEANGNAYDPPLDVRRYVESHGRGGGEGSAELGAELPEGARVRSVPGYPQWGYSVLDGQRVIVNRQTGTVSGFVPQ